MNFFHNLSHETAGLLSGEENVRDGRAGALSTTASTLRDVLNSMLSSGKLCLDPCSNFKNIYLFIYLAVLGLSCSIQDF